jgi:hypothetical protein
LPRITTDPTLPAEPSARKRELSRRRSERRRARAANKLDHVERMVLDLRERFTGAELARMAELLKGDQP